MTELDMSSENLFGQHLEVHLHIDDGKGSRYRKNSKNIQFDFMVSFNSLNILYLYA